MTTLPQQKAYILHILKTGTVPTDTARPDFNGLSAQVKAIEEVAVKSKGNVRAIQSTVDTLSSKNPPLKRLLKDEIQPKIEIVSSDRGIPPLPPELAIDPELTKNLCPQKNMYVEYSRERSPEGYEGFHHACFWFLVSTIDGRRSAVELGGAPKYAPLSVVLAARSSAFSKTETANVIDTILEKSGLPYLVTTSKLTPQKFAQKLAGPIPEGYASMTQESQAQTKRELARAAQRGWKYDEYGKLLTAAMHPSGVMTDFIEMLLKLDDCPPLFDYETIGRGSERAENPFLALLGVLTPASIKKVAARGSEMWQDGFFARTTFTCPPESERKNAPFKRGVIPVPMELCRDLSRFNQRLGVPELDILPVLDEKGEATGKYFKEWVQRPQTTLYTMPDEVYDRWVAYRTILRDYADLPHLRNDLATSYLRLPTMALRVATLAAALEGVGDNVIYPRHWLLGQEQAENWRQGLHELYAQLNTTREDETPSFEDRLLAYMSTSGPKTAREIVQYGPSEAKKLKVDGVTRVLEGLIKAGEVDKEREGRKECYKLVH